MTDYIEQIKKGLDNNLKLLSLAGALTLPDILGSIETGQPASAKSFKNWYKKNIFPNFSNLTAQECWDFRCRFLHQGQTASRTEKYYTNIGFSEVKNVSLNIGKVVINGKPGPKFIDIYKFVNTICDNSTKWLNTNRENKDIQDRIDKCIKRHPEGFWPIINRTPVII